jgi:hypothetical protein
MPRYFFSLVDGKHSAIDKRGQEFDSLSEAHLHALRMFAKLIEFIPDQISPTCQIKITSGSGEPVLTVFLPALASEDKLRKKVGRAGSGFLNRLDKWSFCLTAARMAAEQERR